MTKRVGISIVNYRTGQLVIECLESLIAIVDSLPYTLSVVVVDNLSPDDSLAQLTEYLAHSPANNWITLIAAPKNGGFSYGNNKAFEKLLADDCDYIWLLNPDTRVLPNACEALIDCLNENPTAAIAGSSLQDPDGTLQIASFNFPTVIGELINSSGLAVLAKRYPQRLITHSIPTERCRVDWVAGASMMINADAIKDVGLMDENYFLYFEEVDYCRAFQQAGYDTYFEPASKVIHHVGAATGISDMRKQAPRRPAYWFHSRCYFFQKNYGFFNALVADKLGGLGYLICRLKMFIKGEVYLGAPHFFYDFIRHSSFFSGNLVKAAKQKKNDADRVNTKYQPDIQSDSHSNNENNNTLSLWDFIKEDWQANGKDWTKPGFRAMAVYRFGVWRMGVNNKGLRAPLSLLYRFLFRHIRNHYGIEFPYSIKAGRRIIIEHQSGIVVHGNVEMGDDCIIRQGVTLGNKNLDQPFDAPKLGHRVNVGAGAKVLGSITLGDDAAIGANAVVLRDVPAGAIAAGIPAKIRNREKTAIN